LRLEVQFGWCDHAPEIHAARWRFFRELDRNSSARDAYETHYACRRANYPLSRVLHWHREARIGLVDDGIGPDDERRAAELYEPWARGLAALAEARRFWGTKGSSLNNLNVEIADAFRCAAQARRDIGQIEAAAALLDKADVAFTEASREMPDSAKRHPEFRSLMIRLRFQRAWLLRAQGKPTEHKAVVRDLCTLIRRDDFMCQQAIEALRELEAQEHRLEERWETGGTPWFDSDMPNVSLPQEWFGETHPLTIARRIEFRLWQSWSLVSPNRGPVCDELFATVVGSWDRYSRYAENILKFAESCKAAWLGAEAIALIQLLLEGAARYFSVVRPNTLRELNALKLLLHFAMEAGQNSETHRLHYLAALRQHREVLTREAIARSSASLADWYAVVSEVHKWLEVLVADDLRENLLKRELRRRGLDMGGFKAESVDRSEMLMAARREFENGDYGSCLGRLSQVLPSTQLIWVGLHDLEVLDLWLKCAAEEDVPAERIGARRALLRNLALQYVRQFSETVPEREGQQLALDLLQDLDARDRVAGRSKPPRQRD
jgi:hypothetical protein